MRDLLASKLREEVFAAIRAHTAATVAEAEAATLAIIRLAGNAAALDAARGERAGWRDIASAPRDGTEVLLWGRCERDGAFYGYDCNVGWYADAEMSPTGDAGWMARDLPIEPTHWQPLPPAPGEPAPETADERQAAIVAYLREQAEWHEKHDDGLSGFDRIAQGHREAVDAIESGEWRR